MKTKKINLKSDKQPSAPISTILSSVIETSNASIWSVDKNYCLIFGNSAFHDDCKKGLGQIIKVGESILLDKLPDEDKKEWKNYYDRALNGERFSFERERKYSQNKLYNDYHFGPITTETGQCIGVSVVAHDITEKKLAEESLIRSNKRFEDLAKLLPEAIFEFDTNFKLTYANQRALELFGYSQEEISSGLNALEIIVPEQRELAKSNFAQRLKGAEPGTQEYLAIKKDRSIFPIHYHANSITEGGKLLGARGVVIDISEHKHAEQELVEGEKKFKNIFNNSVVAKSITKTDGTLSVNKAFSQLVGYSEKELNQMKWQEFTHPEDVEKNQEIVESIVAGKINTARWEKRYIHKNGNIVWVDISTTLQRGEKNNPLFFITSLLDITERKKSEKELKDYAELFSLFMKYSPVYTFIKEVSPEQSRVLQASDNYQEMVGITGSEIVGKTMEEIFPPEFAAKITADDWNVVKEEKILQLDENLSGRNYTTIKFPITRGEKKLLAGYTIDITQRKQAEKKLERMAMMLDVAPSSITVHDFNGVFLYANQKTFDLHGYTEEEFLSLPLGKLDTPETAQLIPERMKELAEKGEASFQVEHIKKDGTIIPLEIYSFITKWGNTNAIISVGTDITLRRKTEKALIESEKKLRLLFQNLNAGFALHEIITDKNGEPCDYRFIEVNPAFEKLTGLKASDLIGKTSKVVLPTLESYWIETYGKVALKGESVGFENYSVELKKYYQVNAYSPNYGQFATIFTDITERRQAEVELRSSQQILEGIINTAPVRIFWKDTNLAYLGCNQAFASDAGFSNPKDIIGKDDFQMGWRDQAKSYQSIDIEIIQTGSPKLHMEEIQTTPDGHTHTLLTNKIPLRNSRGEITGVLGTYMDITDVKQIEKDLIKAKEKAEESDRLKSAFLANMSHEIRTPMNGILGFSNLLKEPFLTGEEQRKYIDIIEISGQRMLNTINDIIDISKIEAKQIEISISDFNISNQLEDIISFFKPEANKKGIDLFSEVKLKSDESDIKSDKEKLYAILTNLVKNAIKYCDKGFIEIGCFKKGADIEFYVKDTGKGIPKNRQKAIFDRFIQADIEDKEVREGSGLGLAIAKSYVELLGGRMWVESKKDEGSTFYFTVSASAAPKENKI